jgi:hypothetical protein
MVIRKCWLIFYFLASIRTALVIIAIMKTHPRGEHVIGKKLVGKQQGYDFNFLITDYVMFGNSARFVI